MVKFKFTAKKIDGKELGGTREAADRFDLARQLKSEGYVLVDFSEKGEKKKKGIDLEWLNNLLGKVRLQEKMMFTRNLGVMVGAGLPLARALEVLTKQTKNPKFKKVISELSQSITKGKSLSEAVSEHPDVFPPLFVAMLKSGETTGKMEESLKLLAMQMDKDYTLRRKVKGAMVYPAIVILAMVGIGILMLTTVVPSLISIFDELNVELPMSTRIVIWFSNSLAANSLILALIVFSVIGFFGWAWRKPFFQRGLSTALLHMPLIKGLVKKINAARTARTMSSLVDSGVEILEALDVTKDVLQNVHYKHVVENAKAQIKKGSAVSVAFKAAEDIYPPLLSEMIEVGEETGKLSQMLLRVADFYEEEVAEATKDMATIIEPALMIVIGVAVGFFAVAMMKPMYSIVGGF